jgi:uncharacterized protein YdeI (YjbR/CyaY-like superfamily)
VKKAALANAAGEKKPRPVKHEKKPIPEPADLSAALKKNPAAAKTWERFSPSHRREYLEWITEAKQEETRARRLATTLEWLSEGKSRMWKYQPAKPAAKKAAKPDAKPAAKPAAKRTKR